MGFAQGLVGSNLMLLVSDKKWHELFGDGQATPISGNDGEPLTRTKYLGRVIGAATLPLMIAAVVVAMVVSIALAL